MMRFLRQPKWQRTIDSYLVTAVISIAGCVPSQAAQPAERVVGDWKFTSVLDNVEITSIDDTQAGQLLGKIMSIRKEVTQFGDEKCGAPSLETQRVEPNIYVWREAKISAKKLRLPNPVTVVDIGCTQLFIKQPNQAVIFWDGFFFDATRIDHPKARRRQSASAK